MNDQIFTGKVGKCALCQKENILAEFIVTPENRQENMITICASLVAQINSNDILDSNDWRFLTESIWSEIPAVQVLSWRMLNRLKHQGEIWASDTLEMVYLDLETLEWAEKDLTFTKNPDEEIALHKDANGNILKDGDSVVLIKTLDVKGSSLSAKLGTVVKNIRLVADNPEQIEGRIEGQLIVILTKYLRKQN